MRELFILCSMIFSQAIIASEIPWTELDATYQFRTAQSNDYQPHVARKMHLDFAALKQSITTASKGANLNRSITLPTPSGAFLKFTLEATSVMSPALAERYPEIQTWKIVSTANPAITGRIDIGPRGFHGLFHSSDGDRVFIDPAHFAGSLQTDIYTVLSSRANHDSSDSEFTCELHGSISSNQISARILENPSNDLRTYRLALAVTGEYTQLFGGTKAYALAGITTTVNRLNQVFERDLNINLELIAENDKLIFTSPSNDPFSNQNAVNMAEENILSTNEIIGRDNYDIGHVFGTGKTGGLAFLNAACGNNKAGGVTGSNSPEGDAFTIDYVAHEIGHQLGASHTFNGYQQNCSANNRVQNSAVEPGSGSSIMGYAGICGGDDLQANSDAFFHSRSIAQIKTFTQQAEGASCGTLTASLNNNPEVNAGANYSIPAHTPFALTGSSNDIDGDPLLHSWEQTDIGASSDLYSDLIDNPLFRIWNPASTPTRYFPRLTELLNNKSILGELLPMTDRKLNFSLLVRDNKGGLASDSVRLEVINTGSAFAITSQAIPASLAAGDSFKLNWNVADTDKAPINCQAVKIGFINADEHYTSLLLSTANDGQETISIPLDFDNVSMANLKISCTNNIFFAVSPTEHVVMGGKPIISINPPSIVKNINGKNALAYTLKLSVPAPEEVFIHYQAKVSTNIASTLHGEAVIAKGKTFTMIRIPVAEETVEAAVKTTQLVIEKPDNAQFETGGSQLLVDPLKAAANPEPAATAPTNSGGGSISPLASFALFLLLIARIKSLSRAIFFRIDGSSSIDKIST